MADKEYGIVLSAKDNASAAVKKLSVAMGATTRAVQKMGSMGATTFSMIGAAVVVTNQAVQLFKTGFDAISGLVTGSLEAVRELRGETNPLVLEMDKLATNSLAVKAALGTAFASALLGISKAFSSVGGGAADFLDKNRKLIATRIVQFLFKLAQVLATGVSQALNLANTSWYTLTATVDESIMAVSEFVGAWSEAMLALEFTDKGTAILNARIEKMVKIYNAAEIRLKGYTGAHDDNADAIANVVRQIKALIAKGYEPAMAAAKAFADAAGGTPTENVVQMILRIRNQITRLIPHLDKATKLFVDGLGSEAGVKKLETFRSKLDSVTRRLALTGTDGIGPLRDEMEALYAEIGRPVKINIDLGNLPGSVEAIQLFGDTLTDALDTAVKKYDALELKTEIAKIAAQSLFDAWAQFPAMLSNLGFVAADVFEGIYNGTLSMGDAWGVMAKSAIVSILAMVRMTVMAFAVQAAAAQFAATSIIPFGTLISAGLAAAALGFVEGLLSKLPAPEGFAQGGLVTGGTAGRDSVPAMLMPGEFVLTTKQTESLRKGNTSLVGGSNITINMTSQIPPTKAEMKKHVRQNILPALLSLKAQGMA